jgi:DNA-3-methyladenine glycosylase
VRPPTSRRAPAPSSNSEPRPRRRRLRRRDLPHETVALARFLIGKLLVRQIDGETLVGRIVETEAYVVDDPASHAYRGMTARNKSMFALHAHAYVYRIYGTSWCLNVSSEAAGIGAAALIRAAEPLVGTAAMRRRRGRDGLSDLELARGPGNLCRAFGIDAELDGIDLDADPRLALADDGTVPEVGSSVRIGLTRAADRELRFYARGSAAVSGRRALSP